VTIVIAHRGASRAWPDNTLAAFAAAVALGADAVELDVRTTADGALVVHHDAHLGDGRALVDTVAARLPARVPLLADALEACSSLVVNIEIKNQPGEPGFDPSAGLADAVVAVLAGRVGPAGGSGVDRVLVSSFHLPTIDRVRVLAPALATAWLVVEPPPSWSAVLAERGHGALHPHHLAVTPALLDEAHRGGFVVNAWTLDDPARMAALCGAGLDGVCTNVPDVALRVLGRAPRG